MTERADPHASLVGSLEHVVAANLERHMSMAKPWLPHDYVPWSLGRDYAAIGGRDWEAEDSRLPAAARCSMLVNLLTEDNLPSYHREIAACFGRRGSWGKWIGQWTAEEGRHAIALRDYLVVTRGADPVEMERLRMEHVAAGYDSGEKTALEALIYVSLQELATRVSHRNTGRASGCPFADRLLGRIAADENLHMIFYRDLVSAAFDLDPDATLCALQRELQRFKMPAAGLKTYKRGAMLIALAGIYDVGIYCEEVVLPLVRTWQVLERSVHTVAGDLARQAVSHHVEALQREAARFAEQRERFRAPRDGGSAPPRLT